MTEGENRPGGPDLAQGIAATELSDGAKLVGHVGDEAVLLLRRGTEIFAVGAHCTHYQGPLAEGLVVGDSLRCPWHHARFDLRTGEALGAPAFSPLGCWSVEQREGKIFVRERRQPASRKSRGASEQAPSRIVIVGGGAAGFAAAERLRREGYQGSLVMLSSDSAGPVDRPNLSKDYLAGKAPEEWVPLQADSFYAENGIELRLDTTAAAIDVRSRDLGPQLGDFVHSLHEKHGVVFHLGTTASVIANGKVNLAGGSALDADLVVCGLGVRPRVALAEQAGLTVDRGVMVDAFLETGAPGVFAAGDIARWPDRRSGEDIRIEHWVVAERQGQCAALNMLGHREKFTAVPFFWSQHYDVSINYVGYAPQWDELAIEGDIADTDCLLRFKRNGRVCAVASIFRDLESLRAEAAMEQEQG